MHGHGLKLNIKKKIDQFAFEIEARAAAADSGEGGGNGNGGGNGRGGRGGVGARNMSPLDAPRGTVRWKLIRLMTWTESNVKRCACEVRYIYLRSIRPNPDPLRQGGSTREKKNSKPFFLIYSFRRFFLLP